MGDGWELSCPDWERRIEAGASLVPPLPLYQEEADRVVEIFERLRLPDVAGTPTLAEACGPWFIDIARAVGGALNPATQVRMIREFFLLICKKNAKTSLGALLMLALMLVSRRPRGEFMFLGPTQDIADLAFSQAVGARDLDPWLKKRLHVQEHLKRITVRWHSDDDATLLHCPGAQLKVKTFDTKVATGIKPVGVMLDEVHILAQIAQAARVIGQIRGGIAARPEGFLIMTSTQSENPPTGVFRAELQRARAIRDGRATGNMLPVLYEFPQAMVKDGRWADPANWHIVNPNLGRSVALARLVDDWETAQLAGEEEKRRWASQHLNLEIGLALQSDRWPGADHWEAAADEEVTLAGILARCEVAVVGIDGGGLDDLLGLSVLGRERHTRRWMTWAHAWAHRSVFDRRKEIAARLEQLAAAGELSVVEAVGDDLAGVTDIVARVDGAGLLAQVGLDPANTGLIVDALAEIRVGTDDEADQTGRARVVGVSQGYKLMGAIKTAERKLADGSLVHADQALMDWCVGNAKVEQRGNAVMITKQASGTAKIDPLMALFDAVALMSLNPAVPNSAGIEAWEV
jgi:phage terminase large subunit-like protein